MNPEITNVIQAEKRRTMVCRKAILLNLILASAQSNKMLAILDFSQRGSGACQSDISSEVISFGFNRDGGVVGSTLVA